MRVAPVGLFASRLGKTAQDTFRLACNIAALTHGHPAGTLSAGVLAVVIMKLSGGSTLAEALQTAKACLSVEPRHEETMDALSQAAELAAATTTSEAAISRLGQGWIAEEALAIALYCALVAKSFREGVILAVNHDGDSDSTGAITGNLLGAMYGVSAIPSEWLDRLELRSVITEVADDLYAFRDWNIGDYSQNQELNQKIWRKYPGF